MYVPIFHAWRRLFELMTIQHWHLNGPHQEGPHNNHWRNQVGIFNEQKRKERKKSIQKRINNI
jgi:hypothetical protein